MYKLWTIILVLGMSFPAVTVETRAGRDLIYFSSGELHHVVGEPESSVRTYLESIRDKFGHKNAHKFPWIITRMGNMVPDIFPFSRHITASPFSDGISVCIYKVM